MKFQLNLKWQKIFVFLVFLYLIPNQSKGQNYNYDQGVEFFKNQDYSKAIDCFTKAIDQEPKQGIYYYFRATCYKNLDEKTWALRDISTAISCFGKKEKVSCAGAYNFRGEIYKDFEEYDKALTDYSNAIKLDPTEKDYYFNRASVYLNLNLYEKAKSEYEKILSIDESSLRAFYGLSRVCLETDKKIEALSYANKIIKMDPSYSLGYLARGSYYIKIQEYEQAIDDYISYYISSEYNELGEVLLTKYASKNYTYTITKITTRISSVKSPDKLMILRANINQEIGDYIEAINDYTKLLEICDENDKSYYHFVMGDCYYRMNNPALLLKEMELASELDSTYASIYGYKGLAYNLLKDYKLADKNYDKAINLDGEINWIFLYRAENKICQADYKSALRDLNFAIALDKNNFANYYARAILYKNYLNDEINALKDFNYIINNDTNVFYSANKKQFAYFYLNEKEKAINWQNKILFADLSMIDYYEASKFSALMNENKKSIEYLSTAIKKGFKLTSSLEKDDEFNNIRNSEEFKKIIKSLKELNRTEAESINGLLGDSSADTTSRVTIPMKSKGSGTYDVQCTVNKLKLNMIFDTGASVISISQTEVDFMLKNGYLTENDIVGSSSYMDANGDIEIGTTIILREVDFGGLILKNVRATVVHNKNAPLLFGQSALSKYGKITIDNAKKTITISK